MKADTSGYTDKTPMPFGIHKGKQLADVPASYLIWLFDNGKCGNELRKYIQDNMNVLSNEVKLENQKKENYQSIRSEERYARA
jgi:uncharacterized protein (DUF3820 family)